MSREISDWLRTPIPIQLRWLLGALVVVMSALIAVTSLAQQLHEAGKLGALGWDLFAETSRAILFGGLLGGVLSHVFSSLMAEGTGALLKGHGIEELHGTRDDSSQALLEWIRSPDTTQLSIIGISLRSVLPRGGRMNSVWDAIRRRLEDEEQRRLAPGRRLHVRLLLLDPLSAEGRFRQRTESHRVDRADLGHDVRSSAVQIRNALKEIYGEESSDFLRLRFYDHGSFGFMVLANDHALVEQYCYRAGSSSSGFPVLQYSSRSPSYERIRNSFEATWDGAREWHPDVPRVGTAAGLLGAGITNIYRRNDRRTLGRRESRSIEQAAPKAHVAIVSLSGRHDLGEPSEVLQRRTAPGPGQITLRIVLLDPLSEAAIIRAVSEDEPIGPIDRTLESWTIERHRRSRLYMDALQMIEWVRQLRGKDHSIELRLTPVAPTCGFLRTPGSIFVEQYLLGGGRPLERDPAREGEYPILEFDVAPPCESDHPTPDGAIERMVDAAFDLLWHLSVPPARLEEVDERDRFETHRKMLRTSLDPLLTEIDDPVKPR